VAQEVLFLHIRPQADLSAAGTARRSRPAKPSGSAATPGPGRSSRRSAPDASGPGPHRPV